MYFCSDGSAFAVDFAILRSHVLVPPDGPKKWDRENAFLLFFYEAVHAVPKMGPPGGPIFGTLFRLIFVKIFASGFKKRNVLVSTFVAYGDRKGNLGN